MKKYTKDYLAYREKYYAEKKIGNTKRGIRVLTPSQYRRARNENLTNTDILKAQTILSSKAAKKEVLRQYNKIKKTYSRGETVFHEQTYFGGQREGVEGISYHYKLSGLLKDKNALHYIIANRINSGEDRVEVLADYGY